MKHLPLIITICALAGCAPTFSKQTAQAHPDAQAIQKIVEEQVKSAKASLRPKAIVVVVAEPKTGKILAIDGYERGNVANPGSSNALAGRLLFEPTSTFKPVTAVAALDSGAITPKTKIFCENGSFAHGGGVIKDSSPLGHLTFDEILAESSNIGSSKMALTIDDETYYDYVRKFGFGEKSGLSIRMDSDGLVQPPAQWDALTKARMAFGQNVAVTPIQLTMAYCALANGGLLMKPVASDERPKVVRRVCSERTANLVKDALQATPEEPMTPASQARSMVVGGKTGTALAINSEGGYLPDQFLTTFVGFFPVKDPEYVITVVVDDADVPSEKNYGGLVAAPIFSEIAGKILKLK
jgi:cell division protein FtsI/penicillin-binding protein 2